MTEPGESLDHVIRRSRQAGAHCRARVLRNLSSRCRTVASAGGAGCDFTFPTPPQIRDFHRKGLRAI